LEGVVENAAVEVRTGVQCGAAEWQDEGDIRGRTVDWRAAAGSIAREGRGIRRIEVEMWRWTMLGNSREVHKQDTPSRRTLTNEHHESAELEGEPHLNVLLRVASNFKAGIMYLSIARKSLEKPC
jgi:hypothetical protein